MWRWGGWSHRKKSLTSDCSKASSLGEAHSTPWGDSTTAPGLIGTTTDSSCSSSSPRCLEVLIAIVRVIVAAPVVVVIISIVIVIVFISIIIRRIRITSSTASSSASCWWWHVGGTVIIVIIIPERGYRVLIRKPSCHITILNLTVLAKKVVGLITHNTNLVAITKFLLTFVFQRLVSGLYALSSSGQVAWQRQFQCALLRGLCH